MEVARETVRLGLAARGQAKVKVRQPLHEAAVVATGRERAAIERLAGVVRDELNVKELRFVEQADELGSYDVRPNYRTLGPRFGKAMPQLASAVAALDPAHVAAAVRDGRPVGVQRRRARPRRWRPMTCCSPCSRCPATSSSARARTPSRSSSRSTRTLRREGLAREVVHAVQSARKAAGLAVEDRIALRLGGDDELLAAARAHEPYVAGETLALEVSFGDGDGHDGDDRRPRPAHRRDPRRRTVLVAGLPRPRSAVLGAAHPRLLSRPRPLERDALGDEPPPDAVGVAERGGRDAAVGLEHPVRALHRRVGTGQPRR